MIAPDKLKHAAIGAALFLLAVVATGDGGAGLMAATLAAFGKEAWDARTPGRVVDAWDAWWTVAPAVVGWWLLKVPAVSAALASFAA